jgi:glycosyltransferase involved in cell wall biosynthesis
MTTDDPPALHLGLPTTHGASTGAGASSTVLLSTRDVAAEPPPALSVVVPLYNEVECVPPLIAEVGAAVDALGLAAELIVVDDGSTDGSFEALRRARSREPRLRVVRLARNYGQTAALAAGFAESRGDVVVSLDADLQNDPADIGRLLDRLAPEVDVVNGWRRDRQDPWWSRRLPSLVANRLIGWATGTHVHDYGCTLRAIRGDVARDLRLYGEMHRFIPALAADAGGRVVEVPVHHRPRTMGRSKYGLGRTIRVVLDLVTVKFLSGFSTRPIQLFGGFGLACSGVGGLLLAKLGFDRLVVGTPIGGRPVVLLAILLVVVGVQFVSMGLLGEMLVRTYHESQQRPVYRVRERLGPDAAPEP